ncbi:MAG: ATP-binding protein [Caldilineaceae bacterium]
MMTPSLGERIEAARRSRFVGRASECTLLHQALTAEELPFYVLHIFGPGGIGKTTLLHQFAHLAKEHNIPAFYIDSRELEPSPDRFLHTLHQAFQVPPDRTFFQFLTDSYGRYLLLLDTSEWLTPLDGWLRNHFFPQLPATVLTVLAGRNPPALEWRTDPGWQPLTRFLQLRNLALEESQLYLAKRQVPAAHQQRILDFTYGHPLALSLMADTVAQAPANQPSPIPIRPIETPDIINTLLERFIAQVPSAAHRAALEACSLVRIMTEPLLAVMIDDPHPQAIFAWLRTLSFMDAERRGLFPHDLAREALCLELRWRNPERYAELHNRAQSHYMTHFLEGNRQTQQNILYDYIYLHRDNPLMRPYFEWQETGSILMETAQPADRTALLPMVEQHEGAASATLAAYWLSRQPHTTFLFRDTAGQLHGLLLMVALHQVTNTDIATDPAVRTVTEFLRQTAPLRSGEQATLVRFGLAHDTDQAVSLVQSRIFLAMVQHYLTTPGLAYTFLPCADPDFWTEVFAYADLQRLTAADYTIGGRTYGVYGHDWRVTSPLAWLNLLAEREIAMGIPHTPPPVQEMMIALSESDFAEAVRDALRDFHNNAALRQNPLLRSTLVERHNHIARGTRRGADSDPDAQLSTLRDLLQTTAVQLQQTPRNNKLYRALHHTYFQPAATQEQAAELLDLPFSTYRRHLRAGIDYLVETLWQQELEQGS